MNTSNSFHAVHLDSLSSKHQHRISLTVYSPKYCTVEINPSIKQPIHPSINQVSYMRSQVVVYDWLHTGATGQGEAKRYGNKSVDGQHEYSCESFEGESTPRTFVCAVVRFFI
jgi:hypothetical protein